MTVLRSPLRSPLRYPLYGPLVGKYGNAALALLRGKQGFAVSFIDDAVAVQDNATPSNNFVGTMAQAVDRGILVNASPPTKWLLNSSGILTSGSNLRCQYSAAGVPLGFLPEPQRTNYSTNSEVANIGVVGVSISSNAGIAPNGEQTADLITEDGSGVEHYTGDGSYAVTSGQTYTFSGYVKRGPSGARNLRIRTAIAVTAAYDIDIVNGTFLNAGSGYVSRGLTALQDGWFYFWMTFTASSTDTLVSRVQGYNGSTVYTGDGTSNWYYWGRQLELGAFPTSYIKTEASAVTRAADNLYADLTKVPFGAEYTIIAHAQPSPDTASTAFVVTSVHDTTTNNRMRLINGAAGTGAMIGSVISNNSATAAITSGGGVVTNAFKAAFACATDDFQLVIDGASIGVDNSGATPISPTQLGIGIPSNNTAQWAAPIGFVALIPERLSQADMIARTTL